MVLHRSNQLNPTFLPCQYYFARRHSSNQSLFSLGTRKHGNFLSMIYQFLRATPVRLLTSHTVLQPSFSFPSQVRGLLHYNLPETNYVSSSRFIQPVPGTHCPILLGLETPREHIKHHRPPCVATPTLNLLRGITS